MDIRRTLGLGAGTVKMRVAGAQSLALPRVIGRRVTPGHRRFAAGPRPAFERTSRL